MAQHIVTAPDGTQHIINAPDDATPDQVIAYAQANIPQGGTDAAPPAQPFEPFKALSDLPSKIGSDYDKRVAMAQDLANQGVSGKQTMAETIPEMAATGMGGLAKDVAGDVTGAAYDTLVPPSVRQGVSGTASAIGNSAVGQLVGKGAKFVADEYHQLPQRVQNATDAVGNAIAGVTALAPATDIVKGTNAVVNDIGTGVLKSGTDAADAAHTGFVKDLVSPLNTSKADKIDAVGRTDVQGIFQKAIVQPTTQETAAADAVSQLPGVKPSNTVQANFNAIKDANSAEAENLRSNLQNSNTQYDPTHFQSTLDTKLADLKDDEPLIVGDAETTADKVVKKMQALAANNDQTPAGLLTARQQFDDWALSKKASVYDGNSNAFSEAVKATRQTANDYIHSMVPDVGVKASLAQQTSLFNAMDNIAPKAAAEAPTVVGRVAQRVNDVLPIKNGILKGVAGTAGAVGVGGAALAAPVATGAVLGVPAAVYGGYKAVTAPATRIGLGKVLQAISGGAPEAEAAATAATEAAPEGMKLLPAPEQPKLLPAPDKQIAVDNLGNAAPMAYEDKAAADAARANAQRLGMTPDVYATNYKNQLRQQFGANWDKVDAATQGAISDQIQKAWQQNPQASISDLINQAKGKVDEIAAATGDAPKIGAIGDALLKAKTVQELSKMKASDAMTYLNSIKGK